MTVWPLLHVGVFAAVVMVLGWLWQRRSGNAGPVDVLWAGCLAVAAPYCAWMSEGALLPRVLVAVLGGVWGARLAWHLGVRVFGDPHEDGRYRALREHWNGDQRKFWAFPGPGDGGGAVLGAVPSRGQQPEPGMERVEQPGDCGVVDRRRRRGAGRPAVVCAQGQPGQPRQDVSHRALALFAASQLLLRIRALVCVPGPGGRCGAVAAGAVCAGPGGDVRVPVSLYRHPLYRAAGTALAWRGLRPVSTQHQRIFPASPSS